MALDAIAARPRLVAEPQLRAVSVKLARQPIQRRRCVRNLAVFAGFAAHTALGVGDNNPLLVNVKPDIRYHPHDPSSGGHVV